MSSFLILTLVLIYCAIAVVLICLGILFEATDHIIWGRTFYTTGFAMFVALATLLLGIFGGFIAL